jgi:hypothetical protein
MFKGKKKATKIYFDQTMYQITIEILLENQSHHTFLETHHLNLLILKFQLLESF